MMSAAVARRRPLAMAVSGPAGAVAASRFLARTLDLWNAIVFDMGGTTTDVCLIADGRAESLPQRRLGGHPVRLPSVGVESIGAGGGSLARVEGSALRVGSESAGARPGPACYDRGVTAPMSPTPTGGGMVRRRSVGVRVAEMPEEPRREQQPARCGQGLKLSDVPHAVSRQFVPHDQFEADGRLGESRQLQTHEHATVGTGARLRGGGLVDVTPVELVGEPKEKLTGRRRTSPRRAAWCPPSLNGKETRVAVTPLPSTPVHQHIDPRRLAEPAAQRGVGVRSADRHDDDSSGPGGRHAGSSRRMRDAAAADVFTAPLPIQTTELVPWLIPDAGIGLRVQAPVARGVAR
jgi:hypothetical protein